MTSYARTAIRRLSIRGFRSIRSLELTEIPDLVVLHGPNGAGKSNLLLAAQLVLRAAQMPTALPMQREGAVTLPLSDADSSLGLRPDDFHFGAAPEIRVGVDVALGTKAAEIVGAPQDRPLGRLSMELVVQRVTPGELRFWFERAEIEGLASLGPETDPARLSARLKLDDRRGQRRLARANQTNLEVQLA